MQEQKNFLTCDWWNFKTDKLLKVLLHPTLSQQKLDWIDDKDPSSGVMCSILGWLFSSLIIDDQ